MGWRVRIERKAQKSLKKIPDPYRSNLIETIDGLSSNPRPDGCVKLKGASDLWRVRVNDYRIVYQIVDHELVILIVRIGHRKDIYR